MSSLRRQRVGTQIAEDDDEASGPFKGSSPATYSTTVPGFDEREETTAFCYSEL
jgi:hypothetical protein